MGISNCINFVNQKDHPDILFIHIPKTGGSSLSRALGLKNSTHIKAGEIMNMVPSFPLENCFSFAIVRHPIDRFLSLFSYAKMEVSYFHNNIEPHKALYGKHLDYDLLKNATVEECVDHLLANRLHHDTNWNQWFPQYTWVCDETGSKILVDKIYKLECLEELKNDFKRMFNINLKIPHVNTSFKKSYRIEKSLRWKIEQYYSQDFFLFNY